MQKEYKVTFKPIDKEKQAALEAVQREANEQKAEMVGKSLLKLVRDSRTPNQLGKYLEAVGQVCHLSPKWKEILTSAVNIQKARIHTYVSTGKFVVE